MTLTNAQMAAAITKGGSVLYAGRLITDVNDLPSDQQIAIDAVADDAVLISAKGRTLIDCSGNPNYPAANAGHVLEVSVAGKIGGASGKVVQVGDVITCYLANSPAGTQADVGANWGIEQGNVISTADVPASTDKNYVTDAQLASLAALDGDVAERVANQATYIRTASGAQASLLGGNPTPRYVLIVVEITETFANGDGAKPSFAIGETGTVAKFGTVNAGTAGAAPTVIPGALSGNAALLVTATAGTGTTETGAIRVTVLAQPAA